MFETAAFHFEFDILYFGNWNLFGIRNPESGIWNLESGICYFKLSL